MTTRLAVTRRYLIHVPQLVGRIAYPQQSEAPEQAMRRIVGETDTAFSELQRFLHYLQNQLDVVVAEEGYYAGDPELVDALAGDPGTPGVGYSLGDHEHQALTGAATALTPISTSTEGTGAELARADHTHDMSRVMADVMTKVSLGF